MSKLQCHIAFMVLMAGSLAACKEKTAMPDPNPNPKLSLEETLIEGKTWYMNDCFRKRSDQVFYTFYSNHTGFTVNGDGDTSYFPWEVGDSRIGFISDTALIVCVKDFNSHSLTIDTDMWQNDSCQPMWQTTR